MGQALNESLIMNPITLFVVAVLAASGFLLASLNQIILAAMLWVLALVVSQSLKMANTWQKFVVLRAGKLQGIKGPGLFAIIPVLDSVIAIIDERIQTTAFNAEQALTKDTVPVNVDAVIFWHVHNAEKAALAITDYRLAIDRVAQTSLREMIGSSLLATLLSDRKAADQKLGEEIGRKTADWGITVSAVEIGNTRGLARRHVPSSSSRAGKTSPDHPWHSRSRNRQQIRRCGQNLCQLSHGPAIARHEHHLRNHQRTRCHHSDPQFHGGQHEPSNRNRNRAIGP